ncbi:DedA family protein [Ectobacillus panaciterrae]|uniref:DedA family protein n=1 Tax=Ectobacillus panaciterrae TaxID=363872 RepID=UPI000491808C|nr:DedA family protein [Ectobacillus panaciterrae]
MEQHLNEVIMHYGYIGLIVALAGGVVGLPVPDELLLTFVGYQVSRGYMTYTAALASGFAGAALGITLSYMLGLRLGLPVLRKLGPKVGIREDKIQRTHNLFEKYGPFLLMIGYFLPGVRHLTAYFAGISSLSFRKFCFFAYLGAFIWVSLFVTVGWKLGENWHFVEYCIHQYGVRLTVFVLCLLLLGWIYMQITKKAKQNRI